MMQKAKKNKAVRAFVFSLDAYISVVIILLALTVMIENSLISIDEIKEYYQAKLLSLDALKLYVLTNGNWDKVNSAVPNQYLIVIKENGRITYKRGEIKEAKRVIASSSSIVAISKTNTRGSDYHYKTCKGLLTICQEPIINEHGVIESSGIRKIEVTVGI